MTAPTHSEAERLAALRRYDVLDSGAEREYDDLVRIAAQICGTPISLVTLIDADRQWFKARVGLELAETPREISFCAHAIEGEGLFVVPDAHADERFATNPLVESDPFIRFYAGAPLITPEGHRLGALCVIDRTPRELDEEQREALSALSRQAVRLLELRRKSAELARLKEEFVTLVSHEIRTPLTSITGYVELLLAGDAGELSADQRDLLDPVAINAERLERLVADLLLIERIDAGELKLTREEVWLDELVHRRVAAAEAEAKERGLDLSITGGPLAPVGGDRALLAQALDNLLANAIGVTPPGGSVSVVLSGRADRLAVEVSDTGAALSAEEQERVFERFFRPRRATERALQGTGLGLAIARAIVEAHGGTIEVQGGEGTGASFHVELPIEPGW